MRTDTIALIAGGALVLVALAALAAGMLGTTSVSVSSSPQAVAAEAVEAPEDGSTAKVYDVHVTPGMSLFGIKFRADRHYAFLGFVTPPGCIQPDASGRDVLRSDGECAALPVEGGELSGGGTTAAGSTLAIVKLRIPRECYEVLQRGDDWPSTRPECASTESGS